MKFWHRILCWFGLHQRSSRPRGAKLQIYCKNPGRFLA